MEKDYKVYEDSLVFKTDSALLLRMMFPYKMHIKNKNLCRSADLHYFLKLDEENKIELT